VVERVARPEALLVLRHRARRPPPAWLLFHAVFRCSVMRPALPRDDRAISGRAPSVLDLQRLMLHTPAAAGRPHAPPPTTLDRHARSRPSRSRPHQRIDRLLRSGRAYHHVVLGCTEHGLDGIDMTDDGVEPKSWRGRSRSFVRCVLETVSTAACACRGRRICAPCDAGRACRSIQRRSSTDGDDEVRRSATDVVIAELRGHATRTDAARRWPSKVRRRTLAGQEPHGGEPDADLEQTSMR